MIVNDACTGLIETFDKARIRVMWLAIHGGNLRQVAWR